MKKPNLYVSEQKIDAMFHAVEFAQAGNEQLTFYQISSLSNKETAKQWLLDKGLATEFLGETTLNNDIHLIVRCPLSESSQLSRLNAGGIKLHHPTPGEGKVSLWGLRGGLSMVGQTLQLTSSYLKPTGIDAPTATFAVSNILANISNMVFGSQKEADPHRLRYIKAHVNQNLTEEFGATSTPGIDDQRSASRPHAPKTLFDTLKKYSVSLGEVGLRMFGSFAMAFPVKNWGKAATEFGKGNLLQGIKVAYNTNDTATGKVGIAYLIGKSIALFSKVPDPYNPNPKTSLDNLREKVAFKLSSVIEFGAAGYLSYDRFRNKKVNLKKIGGPDNEIPDYFGAAGGGLFTVGLGIRYFAPFGERQVDMNELKAHLSDALALVPRDKLPQAMAKTIADIIDHFGEKSNLTFGSLYTEVATDLQKQHNIKIPGLLHLPKEHLASVIIDGKVTEKTFARDNLRKSDQRPLPAASHQDRAVNTMTGETTLNLG